MPRSGRRAIPLIRAVTLLTVWVAHTSAHDPISTKVTWSREISRIVLNRCAGCHRTDGAAPMPLTTYEQIRPWLKAVKEEVVSRRMPKWSAARGIGAFENDRSLSPFEIELMSAWIDGGAPKGDVKDAPKPASPAANQIKPSMTLKLPTRRSAPAGEHQTFDVASPSARENWIAGWTFQPNDPAIVQAGFTVNGGGYLGTWVPPEETIALPADTGVQLPAGAKISVTLWYRSSAMQQDFPVQLPKRAPELGLMFVPSAPAREARVMEAACGETTTQEAGEIFAIRQIVGSNIPTGIAVRRPNAPPQLLGWLREFDPGYQATYRLRDAVKIEPGATIEVSSESPLCKRILIQYSSPNHSTLTTNGSVSTTPRR